MKFFRKIHLWLSVPFGIIITLVCFSGAMLVFEQEITRAARHDVYYVAATGTPIPLPQLMETVKAQLPDSVAITGVNISNDPERTYQVSLSKPRRASVFIDQYSGQITGKYERLGFFSTMFGLHRWLLDSANPHGDGMKVGKLLVGISTLVFVIALLTGIIIWIPRVRKVGFWKSLGISTKKGWPGIWKGLHVAGGMWAVVIILAMALTGLTWSFAWYRSAFYAVCGVEHTPRSFTAMAAEAPAPAIMTRSESTGATEGNTESRGEGRRGGGGRHGHDEDRRRRGAGRGEGRGEDRPIDFTNWQKILDNLRAQYPDAPQINISGKKASVTLSNYGNTRASDTFSYNETDGMPVLTKPYSSVVGADRLRGWIYTIHTGGLGGICTRILWMLAALLGASLPLTGYYIWIFRLVKKRQAKLAAAQNH